MVLGFTGPAWSTFISVGIVNLLQLKLSANILKIKMGQIFPWRELFKVTIINVILGWGVHLIMQSFQIGTTKKDCAISISIGIIWMAIYFGIIMRKYIKKQWKEY